MFFRRLFRGILLSFGFLLIFSAFWLGMEWFSNSLENFQEQNKFLGSVSTPIENNTLQPEFPYRDETIQDLGIEAESAISVQNNFVSALRNSVSNGANPEKILFEKSGEEKMPIASLTKLMTAVVVLENYDLSKNLQISKEAEKQDARLFLKKGETFVAKDLLYDMLIESNNSAAYAFSEAMDRDNFIKLMNLKANEIGLKNTYFSSPTGFGISNYSTAKDLVNFAKYLLNQNSPIIQITSIPEFDLYNSKGVFHHKVYNSNELLKDQDLKERIVAGKTGYTEEAGQCLLLILKAPENKGYLINVVLNAKDRFAEMKKIINWEDQAYIWK